MVGPHSEVGVPGSGVKDGLLSSSDAGEASPGCRKGRELLQQLRRAVDAIEHNTAISVAAQGDELMGYSREAAAAACSAVERDEVWELVNPGLDRLLGFGKSNEEICSLIRRGPGGVAGLYSYLEYLVEEKGVVGDLLEGKINVLLDAIDA